MYVSIQQGVKQSVTNGDMSRRKRNRPLQWRCVQSQFWRYDTNQIIHVSITWCDIEALSYQRGKVEKGLIHITKQVTFSSISAYNIYVKMIIEWVCLVAFQYCDIKIFNLILSIPIALCWVSNIILCSFTWHTITRILLLLLLENAI